MRKRMIMISACVLILTGMAPYDGPTEGEIIAGSLNVRTGPGITYPAIASLKKGIKLRILGLLKDWLIVLMPDDTVGMVSRQYVRSVEPVKLKANEDIDPEETPLDSDSERLFALINEYRNESGLKPFIWDERLNETARLKAEDMAENKYFNHNSPIYGTPFNMLRNMGVFYKTASANLAHTADVSEAFLKMTVSLAHRANLVSNRYTNIGMATADDSDESGMKYVVLFFTEV